MSKDRVTQKSIMQAYRDAMYAVSSGTGITASSRSAGFRMVDERNGWQVFVKVCKFSQDKLDQDKSSGGLVGRDQP